MPNSNRFTLTITFGKIVETWHTLSAVLSSEIVLAWTFRIVGRYTNSIQSSVVVAVTRCTAQHLFIYRIHIWITNSLLREILLMQYYTGFQMGIRRVVHGTYLSVPFPSYSNLCLSQPIPWDVSHGIPIGMAFPWTSLGIRVPFEVRKGRTVARKFQ